MTRDSSPLDQTAIPGPDSDSTIPAHPRLRIQEAIRTRLIATGYAATSIGDITREARVSTKTFYQLFADKADALAATLEPDGKRLLRVTGQIQETTASWPERVALSVEALLEFMTLNAGTTRMALIDMQIAGPQATARVLRWLREYVALLTPSIREAPRALVVRGHIADQIAGAFMELLYEHVAKNGVGGLGDLSTDLIEIAIAPYIGPKRTKAFLATRDGVAVTRTP